MNMNDAADRWAQAQSQAAELAGSLAIGDVVDYADAETMGEATFAELGAALGGRGLTLVDGGGMVGGYEVCARGVS